MKAQMNQVHNHDAAGVMSNSAPSPDANGVQAKEQARSAFITLRNVIHALMTERLAGYVPTEDFSLDDFKRRTEEMYQHVAEAKGLQGELDTFETRLYDVISGKSIAVTTEPAVLPAVIQTVSVKTGRAYLADLDTRE